MGATSVARMTVKEFHQLPEDQTEGYELINGVMVEKEARRLSPMARRPHEICKARTNAELAAYLREHPIGLLMVEATFDVTEDASCRPDLAVIVNNRIDDPFEGAPDLAVEVASSETAERFEEKIHLYLDHGATAVWTLFHRDRTVWVFRQGRVMQELREGDFLEEPDLLPGFRVLVARLFEGI